MTAPQPLSFDQQQADPSSFNAATRSYFAIAESVGLDIGRAVRTISNHGGPNTAWLRDNADVARRLVAEMEREGRVS